MTAIFAARSFYRLRNFVLSTAIILSLSACHHAPPKQQSSVDFDRIHYYAQLAEAAYWHEDKIRTQFDDLKLVEIVSGTNVQVLLLDSAEKPQQTLAIRGTSNLPNAREDAEYLQTYNQTLGIYLHSGFDEDSHKIYQRVLPLLDKGKPIEVTGHSLGAAIATVLMMYLHQDGFTLVPTYNFGQPKVTNKQGALKFRQLPLTRVIDENDLVPLVPFVTVLDSVHGQYEHFGDAVFLLEGEFFVFQNMAEQERDHADSFWWNLTDLSVKAHFMEHYMGNIKPKLVNSQQVSYQDREKYIQHTQ